MYSIFLLKLNLFHISKKYNQIKLYSLKKLSRKFFKSDHYNRFNLRRTKKMNLPIFKNDN